MYIGACCVACLHAQWPSPSLAAGGGTDALPPQRRDARSIKDYMRRTDRVPVMTNSESIRELGFNSYAQPAVALNILRDVVLGRDLFDHAFRTFSQRWMFRRPNSVSLFSL